MPFSTSLVCFHDILGVFTGGYASVKYNQTAKPYIDIISRGHGPVIVLGNTFTQGYKRYNYKYTEEDLVEFVPITISDLLKDNYYTSPLQNMLPTHKLNMLYSELTCHIGALAWMREVFHEDGIKHCCGCLVTCTPHTKRSYHTIYHHSISIYPNTSTVPSPQINIHTVQYLIIYNYIMMMYTTVST